MCPEHIQAHMHLNLTGLPGYVAVRSKIVTLLEAQQSSSNPDAMDVGSLNGQRRVCVTLWDSEAIAQQNVPNVARGVGRQR